MFYKISLCITSYYKDYHLVYRLFDYFTKQTTAPNEIISYTSGVSNINLPENLAIKNIKVPIIKIINSDVTIQSVARNLCARSASGDIIVFFDVDDFPHPQKLEITEFLFKKYNGLDFLLHNYEINNTNFKYINLNDIKIKKNLKHNVKNTNIIVVDNHCNYPVHHAHIAVKKDVFNKVKFNESKDFFRKEDGKFCQDLLSHKYTGMYCEEKLVSYTII